ncbi:MAG: flavin reductase family protein [Clostridiales Family XIII bacterium]|jgi:flavin reductase (DIM6/NTAB) family NADH-FMN oxidoreductase RutF|nr:flavin reductase family protein [Clostridiales Family XIII bacterium]
MDIMAMTTKLTYGLHVASVQDAAQGRAAGFVIDAVCQLSMGDEPVFCFSVMNKNYSKDCIAKEGVFNVSVLPENPTPFVIANFGFQTSKDVAKWDVAKAQGIAFTERGGLPVLDEAVAWGQFQVFDARAWDTHTTFFCHPTDADYLHADVEPLRYADYFSKWKQPVMDAFAAYKAEGEK